jgi:hypothetical protein
MVHNIAHQADIHQVDGMAEGLPYREHFVIVGGIEVGEDVPPPPVRKPSAGLAE